MEALLEHVSMFAEELQSGELGLVLSVSSLCCLNEMLKAPMENTVLNKLKETIECLKCLRLCPSNNIIDETEALNLSYFPNLSSLEIKRINVEEIILDPSTLTKLQYIKCHFAQHTTKEILKTISHSPLYSHLTRLDLRYNKLETWDSDLMCFMPSLDCLNLSNNRLKVIDLEDTPKLRTLYASFNMLQCIPCVSFLGCCCVHEIPELSTLHLHNNLICDDGLHNLQYLQNLKELTLANNLLQDYDCLSELSDLPELKKLSLEGNPFSFSKNYRISSAIYLHENACVNLFLLDGKKLTKEEKHQVGSFVSPSYVTHQPHDRSIDCSFEILVPVPTTSRARPLKKTRDALISENTVEKAPRKNVTKPESPKKHLETKVQIENIRGHFGEENWLHKQAGSVIQNLMGLQYIPKETANVETNTDTGSNSSVSIFASSPNPTGTFTDEFRAESAISDTEDIYENTKNQEIGEYILPDSMPDENKENPSNVLESSLSSENDDTEGTNYIFTATKEPDDKDVFLVYNNVCFKEKDSLNVDKIAVWPLKNITSCSQLSSDGAFTRVHVTFHSYKPSLTERIYSMETTEASLFCSLLREELESRSLSAMNQTVYHCIKCSTLFSVEKTNNNRYHRVNCQACGSNAVLEMEEPNLHGQSGNTNKTSDVRESTETKESNAFVKSPSQSSIGSANSLKTLQDAMQYCRNDSDIEVISNPSQSSVEVLEVLTRKKSSEERQLVALPELVTLPEHNVSNQGLTESSSSGSLTDSICTAYDGSRRRTVMHDDCTVLVEEEDENKYDKSEIEHIKSKSTSHQDEQNDDFLHLSHVDFSKIDHRVKLYLLTVHFQNNEDFVCVLKCHLMAPNQEDYSQPKLIVFSTCFIYVFQIEGNTSSDIIESWLKLEHSYNITHVESITMLPYQLGFHLKIRSNKYAEFFITLLLDSKQTPNFMKYINETAHFKAWSLAVKVSDTEKKLTESIVQCLEETSNTCLLFLVPLLHIFTINLNVPQMTSSNKMVAVILTESYISIKYKFCESLLHYADSTMSSPFTIDISASVSSLLNMDIQRHKSEHVDCYFVTLMFEVEDDDSKKHIWKIGFTTSDERTEFTDMLQRSWEKLFGVQFPNVSYTDE